MFSFLSATRGGLKITKQKKPSKSKIRLIATIISLPVMIPVWIIGWLLTPTSQKQRIKIKTQPRRVYLITTAKQQNLQPQHEEPKIENEPMAA